MSAADEQEFFDAVEVATPESQPCQNSEVREALDSMGMHSSALGLPCKRQATQRTLFFKKQYWLCDEHLHGFELTWREWLNCPWC
jgi:hypothetical protein